MATETTNASYKPAGVYARFWAAIIDGMVLSIPIMALTFIYSLIGGNPRNVRSGGDIVFSLIVLLIYFAYFVYVTAKYGTTVGKDAYGLRVVQYKTKNNLTLKQSFIREFVKSAIQYIIPIFGGIFALINALVTLFSKEKRGFHDKAGNSQVVVVKGAWKMKKQVIFFGGYIALIILLFFVWPAFFIFFK